MSHNRSKTERAKKVKPSCPIGTWKMPGPPPAYADAPHGRGVAIHVRKPEVSA